MVALAISRADLVIIPSQGSHLDAEQAARAVQLVRMKEETFNLSIPMAVLFTRTSAAIRTRDLKRIEANFAKADVPVFNVRLTERAPYRALFAYGGTLSSLDPSQVSGIPQAIENATSLCRRDARHAEVQACPSNRQGGMMNTVPADIFEDDLRAPVHRPTPEEVRALAETADFRSRQPLLTARAAAGDVRAAQSNLPAASPRQQPRRYTGSPSSKTGRSERPSSAPLRLWKKKCEHERPDRENAIHRLRTAYPQPGFSPVGIGEASVGIGEKRGLFPWGLARHLQLVSTIILSIVGLTNPHIDGRRHASRVFINC